MSILETWLLKEVFCLELRLQILQSVTLADRTGARQHDLTECNSDPSRGIESFENKRSERRESWSEHQPRRSCSNQRLYQVFFCLPDQLHFKSLMGLIRADDKVLWASRCRIGTLSC